MEDILTNFDYPTEQKAIIKVIGVGGGGGNAVTHMYKEGIQNVSFMLCNTDEQALLNSAVPVKLVLGREITDGLGAGNKPHVGKAAAEASIPEIQNALDDGTKMAFVVAGMGGGTGTGAAPIIAKTTKEMGVLTVGIVTIPFLFELKPKILQALRGVEEIRKNVDALLVINNAKLIEMYGNLDVISAFKQADSTLTTAARSIAEIITIPGHVNLDFADVNTTLKDGGVAIMSSGFGEGEERVSLAFENALNSPLLNNNNVFNAKKILFNVYFGSTKPLKMDEMDEVTNFMAKFEKGIEVIWGTAIDDSLENDIKITILATGFGTENIPMMAEAMAEVKKLTVEEEENQRQTDIYENGLIKEYYGQKAADNLGKPIKPKLNPFIFTVEQMDNNEVIEAVINHPAYNRIAKVLSDIAEKAAKQSLI
jgi:cell division protein FtsZ